MFGRGQSTAARRILDPDAPWIALALFTVAYLPFISKPFHVDDPLFLWAARQIQSRPFDFYGFAVNWYGTAESMAGVMQNPPLTSYYVALAALVGGWGEVALHLAMLLPALGVILGTFRLARTLDADPLMSALLLAFTPAFLVSATTVMSDVLALCLWVWAVDLWVRGQRGNRHGLLATSAVLVSAGFLTKYVDVALVPLLLADGFARRRRLGWWVLWLLVPLTVMAAYEAWTKGLYGRGHFIGAALYATQNSPGVATSAWRRVAMGLAFTGGAFLPAAFFLRRVWPARLLLQLATAATALGVAVGLAVSLGGASVQDALFGLAWGSAVQLAVLGFLGALLLALPLAGLRRDRSADSLLLALWVLGVFAFAAFVNWSVNVRSVLPMAPAVAILLARRVAPPGARRRLAAPIAAAACVSILVAWSDHRFAATARDSADWVAAVARSRTGKAWFQGHWGFQYYAEQHGLLPVDLVRTVALPGDILAIPGTNTGTYELPRGALRPLANRSFARFSWLSTMSLPLGAGFYSDVYGPLPFAFGDVPQERVQIFAVERRIGAPVP